MRILGISGSLQAASSSSALLEVARAVAPSQIRFDRYRGLGDLPHFNPDDDGEEVLPHVQIWREALRASQAIVFSTPEYAHGVPGVLKNALDWVVGSGEFAAKPVTLFLSSPRRTYAQASLTETLAAMAANVVTEASVALQLLGTSLSASQIVANLKMTEPLRAALDLLASKREASAVTETWGTEPNRSTAGPPT